MTNLIEENTGEGIIYISNVYVKGKWKHKKYQDYDDWYFKFPVGSIQFGITVNSKSPLYIDDQMKGDNYMITGVIIDKLTGEYKISTSNKTIIPSYFSEWNF